MESRALSVKIKQGEDMTQHTIQADRSTTVLDMKQQVGPISTLGSQLNIYLN